LLGENIRIVCFMDQRNLQRPLMTH
jgi:hypothetical protein